MANQPPPNAENTSTTHMEDSRGGAKNERSMEQRVRQLEMKLEGQQALNAGLHDDIKDLKELVNGDRHESKDRFSHHDAKKRKLFALLDDVNKDVAKLQDDEKSMATKAELQTLSRQLDDLRTHVDRMTTGMHAPGPPPAPDLIAFSPAGPLINFDATIQSPNRLPVASNTPARTEPPVELPDNTTPALPQPPSPQSPAETRRADSDEATRPPKKVKFDLATTRERGITPSDLGSEDPLAPDATLRKQLPRKRITRTFTPKVSSPLATKTFGKSLRQTASLVLDRFKSGRLDDESDDEDQPVLQAPASDDNIVVAAHTTTSNREAPLTEELANRTGKADGKAQAGPSARKPRAQEPKTKEPAQKQQAASMRRSSRGPKPKDFGDVEVHGWKKDRVRKP